MPITPSNQETKREHPEEFFDLVLHRGLVVDVSTGNTCIALEASMGELVVDNPPAAEVGERVIADLVEGPAEFQVYPQF